MKRFAFATAAIMTMAASLSAQTVIDDFEAGITGWTVQGFGGEAAVHITTDGAASTAGSLELTDGGFSFWGQREYAAGTVATDGNYRIGFWYRNGFAPNDTFRSASIQVDPSGGTDNLASGFVVSGNPATAVENWTYAETSIFALTNGSPFTVRFAASNGALTNYRARLDQIQLVEIASLPVEVTLRPISGDRVGGNTTLTATVTGGSGTYTQVAFDVNDDSSVEFTDSTPGDGFTFNWDTTAVANETPIVVRATATDNAAATGTVTATYQADNNNGGRVTRFSSDFNTWSLGLPNGWTRVDTDAAGAVSPSPDAVVTELTTGAFSGSSLQINYPTQPDPYRYTLRSDSFPGGFSHYILKAALRGNSFTRLYYFYSTDGGTTWTSTAQGLTTGAGGVWEEQVDSPRNAGNYDAPLLAVATHFFGTGNTFVDDVSVTSTAITSVNEWDLY